MQIDKNKFWQWAYSDFLSNAARGVLAEYIVAEAFGCLSEQRIEWDAYDCITPKGVRIEVKSSAYLQTWEQKKPSKITFDVAQKRSWYANENRMSVSAERAAHIYVFCIFEEQDCSRADPLQTDQWSFIVMTAEKLTASIGKQKQMGLSTLVKLAGKPVAYENLRAEVERLSADIAIPIN